jgi:2-octaprenyl-6-methoxyphenol hydroxylase
MLMSFDVIIIGGGMVGATLAAVLKNTDIRVGLVDASRSIPAEDERLIALNDASVSLFENSGLWAKLQPYAVPIKQVHVSQRGRFGITRIDASVVGLSALGYVVPAKYINAVLEAHLSDARNITFIKPATLESFVQDANGVDLSVKTDQGMQFYHAKLVIGADGSYSTVRKLLDIPTETTDYKQSALVTTTTLMRDHDHIAYERFLDEGALAMLPLMDMKVATIWTAEDERIAELLKLSDHDFLRELQDHFGYRLGRLQSTGVRAVYPLKMIKAKYQHQQHVYLIGNAAHTIHPIAAQGLNLALYEVAVVATALLEKNLSLMDELEKPRFSETLSHRLTELFSSDLFVVNQFRQAGLVGLDVMSGLKKRFATKAIGRSGFIPTLLRRKDG